MPTSATIVQAPTSLPTTPANTGELAAGVAAELGEASAQGPIGTTLDALDRTLESAVERAFLSPRVVDQAAFDSLAATLRALTGEAQSQARALAGTTSRVQALHENVRGLSKDLQTRVEAAVKTLPTLDARIARTQALLDRVSNETALSKAREVRDSIVQEISQQRDALVREAVASALLGAKEKLEADLASMVRGALDQARADAILGAKVQSEAMATTRVGELATPLDSIDADAPRDASAGPAMAHDHGHAAGNALATRLDGLAARARDALLELESGLQRMEARAGELRDQAARDLERDLARARQGEAGFEEVVSRAETRLGNASSEAERRTEAVATEIAEQLLALRSDASGMIEGAKGELRLEARSLVDDVVREAVVRVVEQSREELSHEARRVVAGEASREVEREVDALAPVVVREVAREIVSAQVAREMHQIVVPGVGERSLADEPLRGATREREEFERLLARLEEARASVAAATARCDDRVLAATTAMDTIEDRAARLQTQLHERIYAAAEAGDATPARATSEGDRDELAQATREAVARVEQAAARVQAWLQQQQQTQQQQAVQLHQVTLQAMQAGQWLSGLIGEARQRGLVVGAAGDSGASRGA